MAAKFLFQIGSRWTKSLMQKVTVFMIYKWLVKFLNYKVEISLDYYSDNSAIFAL